MSANDKPNLDSGLGPGQPDYGHNNPTGGSSANIGNINPQSPSSGTANYHPDRRQNKQTAPNRETIGNQSFRCADAGYSDCRWQIAMASSNELWNEIERHHADQHGTMDEAACGRIENAIRVRRAA